MSLPRAASPLAASRKHEQSVSGWRLVLAVALMLVLSALWAS